MNRDEYLQKLSDALTPLSKGETLQGEPLDFAKIAAETWPKARAFARKIALGQAETAYRLRGRRFK